MRRWCFIWIHLYSVFRQPYLALRWPCRAGNVYYRSVFVLLLCTIHSAVWNIFNVIELHTAASSRVKIQKHSSQKEAMAANLIQNPLTYKYKKLLQTLIKLLRKMASWGRSCLCSAKSTIIDQYLFLAWQPPPRTRAQNNSKDNKYHYIICKQHITLKYVLDKGPNWFPSVLTVVYSFHLTHVSQHHQFSLRLTVASSTNNRSMFIVMSTAVWPHIQFIKSSTTSQPPSPQYTTTHWVA